MQNKLLFSLVILLVITVQFIASESSDRKSEKLIFFFCFESSCYFQDSKTDKDNSEVVSLITTKKKTSRVNDQNDRSSNRRDRLPSSHRSRPRGPSSYDEDDEWSLPYGYRN